ncbi:PucR family transcriptional regulator [Bacillus xiapuensis]|uniref:PucR family transcriptional regulator ligand-binding domain-containing protein n=1 Tax=Bacillus xiapuensis TaxID=2014075 RepID=A0ABU6NDQ8_9BACI|nr:PucR family transcriptional regulator ligand-binding domain-containing protein [Bacillus xiapuensis]
MTITVRELIENPHLKSTIIAGSDGLERKISWAHSCELNDPSPWLTGEELIMTNGLALPHSENEQVLYIKRLINAGANGLAIGKELHAPEITKGLLVIADENAFPVLLTDYEVPWIAFSKTVASANSNQNHAQVIQTLRIYDVLRKSINHTSPEKIIDMLNKIIDSKIYVLDANNNRQLFHPEKKILTNVLNDIQPTDTNFSTNQINQNKSISIQLPIPSTRPTILRAVSNSITPPDSIVLRHITTILGLIVERETSFLERQTGLGAEIFREIIEGQVTDDIASILLKEHGLGRESLCIIACSPKEKPYEHERLHYWLNDFKIPHLITSRENGLLILLPKNLDTISNLRAEVQDSMYIGISDSIIRLSRIPDAYQEALWALNSAETKNINMVYYGDSFPVSPFLPRNRLKAEELVKQVLGNLLKYDDNHNAELTKTLYIYLNENRSWKNTAEKLHIHKQTLVYRINRIEEITGYRLDDISNISELWLTLEAAKMLDIIPNYACKI